MPDGHPSTRTLLFVQLIATAAAIVFRPSPAAAVLASAGDVARWGFIIAIVVVAATVIGATALWGAHGRLRWWTLAIAALGASALIAYVAYGDARDTRTCAYLGSDVVIGTVLTPKATEQARDQKIADCGGLLAEFAGVRADVWTRDSIAQSERLLTWLPVAAFALLVGAVLAAVEVAGARLRAAATSHADGGVSEMPVSLERLALSESQVKELNEALRDAFPRADQLDQLLFERLSKNRQDITLKDNYSGRVFDVLMTARAEGWTERLIEAAITQNPDNPRLRALAGKLRIKTPEK